MADDNSYRANQDVIAGARERETHGKFRPDRGLRIPRHGRNHVDLVGARQSGAHIDTPRAPAGRAVLFRPNGRRARRPAKRVRPV
jgi:hypothetical protein